MIWLEGRIGTRRIQTTLGTKNYDAAVLAKNRIERALAEGATSEEWPRLRGLIPKTVFSNLASIVGYTERPQIRPHTWADLSAAFIAEAERRIALGKLRDSTWTRYQHTLSVYRVSFNSSSFGTGAIEPSRGGQLQGLACRADQTEKPQP